LPLFLKSSLYLQHGKRISVELYKVRKSCGVISGQKLGKSKISFKKHEKFVAVSAHLTPQFLITRMQCAEYKWFFALAFFSTNPSPQKLLQNIHDKRNSESYENVYDRPVLCLNCHETKWLTKKNCPQETF